MRKTLIVNLLAGSGAGKSTNAARLFAMLKDRGIETELATEYVKDMVWEGRSKVFECQPYIFGKQLYKIQRLVGSVDVVVTDSPILLSALYDPEQDENFRKFILKKFNQFNNLNIFVNRVKPFNPNGRNEKTEEEAKANDVKLIKFLLANQIPFSVIDGDEEGCKIMLDCVLQELAQG
jgi:hypothetical protein